MLTKLLCLFTYLQVKLQFSGHPQVYNDFLDIMKEFKSQSIDTPGVIKRVSLLFRGHPDLIVGFNTFLPPGYKIAVEANETISVEQPGQQAMSLSMFTTTLPSQAPAKPPHLGNPLIPDPLPPTTQHGATSTASSGSATTTTGPPVEFNHAIQYVNKIKVCYQSQPEIYKSFLDILHKYQNEQKMLKEGTAFPQGYRPLTEVEVYALVTDLFKDQPQLLAEFSQFLPDASGTAAESALARFRNDCPPVPVSSKPPPTSKAVRVTHQGRVQQPITGTRNTSQPPTKKAKTSAKEVSFPESEKFITSGDLSYFDKIKDDLGEQDYADLLRCIELYTKQVTSPAELLVMIKPYINRLPELQTRLLEFLKQRDESVLIDSMMYSKQDVLDKSALKATYMVDLSTCKGEAVSYRLLPKSYTQPVCSGRSELCDEVLNDQYALHAAWPDDITSLGPHRKNQYEEHMYQCEDERYELDMVLELNTMAKTALMSVMSRLKNFTSPDDVARFRLDDTLGGNSEVLMRAALNRLYGDKTTGIIEGLKCNPAAAVPIVLRRLVAKEKEWRTAQHGFNRIWREQNERYYLKSLDHQAAKFKQMDVKQIRSKTLMKEIESEMQESPKEDNSTLSTPSGLHVNMCCDSSILSDAASLIINHVRRQSALQLDDKYRIRHVLFLFMPSLLRLSIPLPPNLDKDGDDEETIKTEPEASIAMENGTDHLTNGTITVDDTKLVTTDQERPSGIDESYSSSAATGTTLFYGNDNWYYFLRLYMMLCERLKYFSGVAARLIEEEMHYSSLRSASVSAALKLRNPNAVEARDSYRYFLELVRSLLDGNVELSSFEDQLRDMFGIHAYVAFTIDKLIQNITRQLQYIATKDGCWQLATLYADKNKKCGSGDDDETASYQKEAEQAISDDKCFRVCVNREKMEMTIECIELSNSSSSDEQEQSVATAVLESVGDVEAKADVDEDRSHPPQRKATFLSRNLRRAHAMRRNQMPEGEDAKMTESSASLPSCVQLLNVESDGACLYTCGALTNAKQVCALKIFSRAFVDKLIAKLLCSVIAANLIGCILI